MSVPELATAPGDPTGAQVVVGMTAVSERALTEADVAQFAALSGDRNPVHLDEGYARATPFGGRVAHGMLSASFVSAVIAMQLPGPGSVYLSQTLSFRAPVRIGDTVVTEVTVTHVQPERRRAVLRTVCRVGARVVLEGEAVVLIWERRPEVRTSPLPGLASRDPNSPPPSVAARAP